MGRAEIARTRQRFLDRISLSLRPNTVRNARTAIDNFIRYLEAEHPEISSFSELERPHFEGWLRHLAKQGLRRSTRRNYLIKAEVFFRKIERWRWTEAPKAYGFRRGDRPPENRGLPRPLSEETDCALREELRKRAGLIDKAILFMRVTGLRRQEALDLEVDALRALTASEWALHVPLGKLHSERVIPLEKEAATLFEELCQLRGAPPPVRHPETGKAAQFLIVRPDGTRYSGDVFRYHLRKIERELRLREHPTPHRLRHTYATEMLRAGMSLPVLMKLLGHRTLAMTLRYAEVTGIDVRRGYIETLEALKDRYEIPSPPEILKHAGGKSRGDAIVSYIETLAAEMETFRRDQAKSFNKKRIQRLVERLRRLAKDFKSISS